MPQRIVDQLEAVEIQQHDGGAAVAAGFQLQRVIEALVEHQAVRQLGQHIMVSDVVETLFAVVNALTHLVESRNQLPDFAGGSRDFQRLRHAARLQVQGLAQLFDRPEHVAAGEQVAEDGEQQAAQGQDHDRAGELLVDAIEVLDVAHRLSLQLALEQQRQLVETLHQGFQLAQLDDVASPVRLAQHPDGVLADLPPLAGDLLQLGQVVTLDEEIFIAADGFVEAAELLVEAVEQQVEILDAALDGFAGAAEDAKAVGGEEAELGYDQGPQVAQVQQVDQQLVGLGIVVAFEIVAHLVEQVAHPFVDRQHLREHVAGGRDPALVVAAYGHQPDAGLVHGQRDLDDEIVEGLGIDFVEHADVDAGREIHQPEQ